MTTTPEAARLAPCPFCQAQGRETVETDMDYPSKKFMFIQCTRCGARTANVYGSGDPSEWADARANWNTRLAALSQPDEARDAARYRHLRKVGGRVWHITSPDGSQLPDDVKAAAYDDCVDRERAAAMTKKQP
jgi:hypothetical protein